MTITILIKDFQDTSRLVAETFYEKFRTKKLLLAVNSDRTIPRRGSFGIINEYAFHGCGLYAKLVDAEIDFDFGENNRADGFDAWRLKNFAESKQHLYSFFDSEKKIQNELDNLEMSGLIHKPGTHPGSSNYYWTTTSSTD